MPKPSGKDPIVSLARYSEIGFIIPAAVLLGFFFGKVLDYYLHTKWLYLVGLLFGSVVGFWQVIRMAFAAFGNGSGTASKPTPDPHNSSDSPSKHD
ncbi:MAG: AtpZ/AtpI family protein [Terriglobales bacterium]